MNNSTGNELQYAINMISIYNIFDTSIVHEPPRHSLPTLAY